MDMIEHKRSGDRDHEAGFAAIVIAIVMVTVLSLLTVGFAELMRKEQRSALDRQLSTTAYYAAESGINDARRAIEAGYTGKKTKCSTADVDTKLPGHQYLADNKVGTDDDVTYSCLLINPAPKEIKFGGVGREDDNSVVTKITGTGDGGDDQVINELVISWGAEDGTATFAPAGSLSGTPNDYQADLTDDAGWSNGSKYTGLLRTQLTPIDNPDRSEMRKNTYVAFFYPLAGSGIPGSSDYSTSNGLGAGSFADGQCNSSNAVYHCSVKVTGLSSAKYLLRINSIYDKSTIKITAYGGGKQLRIKGAQSVIDSTGNARGVLKRVQVSVSNENTTYYPQYSINGMSSICKQLHVLPDNVSKHC